MFIRTDAVYCPTCRARPGRPCANRGVRHIDHDNDPLAHRARILRADALADGACSDWRRDELLALILPLQTNGALLREGRAS
jgi:hypothetical protein